MASCPSPVTPSGYRAAAGADAEARLRFIVRGKRLGLSLEQIGELLGVWDGTNCALTGRSIFVLVEVTSDDSKAEIAAHLRELRRFSQQLAEVRAQLDSTDAPELCSPELEAMRAGSVDRRERGSGRARSRAKVLEGRMNEFGALFRASLIASERTAAGIRFRFANRDGVEAQGPRIPQRELECCSFFQFASRRTATSCGGTPVDDPAARPILADFLALPDRA